MQKLLSVLAVLFLLVPPSADALGKRPMGRTTTKKAESTTGVYMERQHLWLPGKWDVTTEPTSLMFTRKTAAGKTEKVHLFHIPREQCGYGIVRMRALKAWGGKALDQSQGRIEVLKFGTVRFMGYSWIEPEGSRRVGHWCIGQDLRGAVEVTAPADNAELMKFMKADFLLQLVQRKGRSVLPWPLASKKAASDPMK